MIKDALQWLKEQIKVPDPVITINGRQHSTIPLTAVTEPTPTALKVHTLTGIVDYINAHKEEGFDDLDGETGAFIQVVSPREVRLCSSLFGPFHQRKIFLTAELPENRAYRFGDWYEPEDFIIALQAHFVQDEKAKVLLTFVGSIQEEDVKTSKDNGYSQEVMAKKGIALVTTVEVPNPVTLHPYRTFLEVDQPEISCVLRLRRGPEISLHEADGGLWRLEAIGSIKEYLVKAVNVGLGQKIPVIA